MSRLRTVAALVIFLFGSTFLWFMPSFLGAGITAHGATWSVIQILVLVTVVAFAEAAWGVYKAAAWWRPLAIGSSTVGAVVLPVWWIAVSLISGVANVVTNLVLHAAGIAVLLAVLLVPSLTRGLDRRLTGHRQGLA